MEAKKFLIISIVFMTLLFCSRNPYISSSEIEELTKVEVSSVTETRSYEVSENSGMEQVVLYESENGKYIGIFAKQGGKYSLIRNVNVGKNVKILKLMFINPNLPYSHIMIIAKKPEPVMYLIDDKRLFQKIVLSEKELQKIFVQKGKNEEEILKIGDLDYRFDSFAYITLSPNQPLFYLEKVTVDGENSWIIVKNKGAYTGSAIITFGFPDLKPEDIPKKLKMIHKLPTVKLYPSGSSVYKKGGGKINIKYPMIEINKEPFGSNFYMKLPLFLDGDIGRIYMRIAFLYRGRRTAWPLKAPQDKNIVVTKTQQGFLAYEYMVKIQE